MYLLMTDKQQQQTCCLRFERSPDAGVWPWWLGVPTWLFQLTGDGRSEVLRSGVMVAKLRGIREQVGPACVGWGRGWAHV